MRLANTCLVNVFIFDTEHATALSINTHAVFGNLCSMNVFGVNANKSVGFAKKKVNGHASGLDVMPNLHAR